MCLLLFAFVHQFAAAQEKVDSYLLEMLEQPTYPIDCLISFESPLDVSTSNQLDKKQKGEKVFQLLNENARLSQNATEKYLLENNIEYSSLIIANAIYAKLNKHHIDQISKFKMVKKIMFNPTVSLEEPINSYEVNPRDAEPEWGIKMIGADSVWNLGYKGQNVVVAGQDTGYDWDNDVLIKKYRGYNEIDSIADHNYNWHDAIREISPLHGDTIIDPSLNPCGLNIAIPCDDHGHGTHTMGTMVGSDTINAIGVAPDAKWIACRNMERAYGTPFTYLECFEWFLAPTDLDGMNPDPLMSPHVINNSWSCPEMEGCNASNWNLLEEAVNNLKAAGIVVVVSAGNAGGSGCGSIRNPSAIFENSFTIGATASNDTIANFSSRGTVSIDSSFRMKPNVSAPGLGVRSCLPENQYASFSGTSMAGPHVAGAVALIISANPSLAGQVETIEDILESTAVMKIDSSECHGFSALNVPNHVYGFGRINVLAAVEKALTLSRLEELEESDRFLLYPNPSNDLINLSFKSPESGIINIYDVSGRKIQNKKIDNINHISINIQELTSGTYLLEFETGGNRFIEKFIKTQ